MLVRSLRDGTIRAFNISIDFLLHIQPNDTLNCELPARNADSAELAARLRRVVNQLKAEHYDAALQTFDYSHVAESKLYAELRACSAKLQTFDPLSLHYSEERIAFWLNVYNVLVIDAVIRFDIKKSVWEDWGFFRRAAYNVGGVRCSAEDIEHGILRRNRRPPYLPLPVFTRDDPRNRWAPQYLDVRIHGALNCASQSCPPIAVYEPNQLHPQLDLAARSLVNATTRVVTSAHHRTEIFLSPIFKWYASDFGGRQSVLEFILTYLTDEEKCAQIIHAHNALEVKWSRYEWSLNH